MQDILRKIKDCILSLVMLILRVFPIDQRKILFSSFWGKGYNNNPRRISRRFENTGDVRIVWVADKNVKCPTGVVQVQRRSLRYMYELATAKVWVDNQLKAPWEKKRDKQFFLETWHSPVCIKAVAKDSFLLDEKNLEKETKALKDKVKSIDVIVAESEWRKKNIQDAFMYNGEILEAMFEDEKKSYVEVKKNVENFFDLGKNDKVLLYTPTFRRTKDMNVYSLDYNGLLNCLERNGEKWRIIVRLHPTILNESTLINYSEKVLNGSFYPDIADLIDVAEYVITDYSSVMFKAMRASKKVLLFTLDLDNYVETNRRLYFDIRSMPAPLAKSNEELIYNLIHFDEEEYEMKRKHLIDSLGYYDKDAAIECERIIKSQMNKG